MTKNDRMSLAYSAVPSRLNSPWARDGKYSIDVDLLLDLVNVQMASGGANAANTGSLALAVDVWIATELRRAGLEASAVWPRPEQPRVLPQALSSATGRFNYSKDQSTREIQQATIQRLAELAGQSSTNILGGFFAKEIDVVMAEYDRGLELGVSTKTMTNSFGKNITNRFEEAAGDLLNIRRRFPLATFGYVYLVTSNVFEEPHGWERIKDMCRKLKTLAPGDDRGSYDASCLIVLDRQGAKAKLLEDEMPADLHPNVFFKKMLHELFSRSPVSEHIAARNLWEQSAGTKPL